METETTTQNHGAAQALYLTTDKDSKKMEDDGIEEEDNTAAIEEAEEDEVAKEVNDAAKDGEVKTNYPR
jgi:hypothetical protein